MHLKPLVPSKEERGRVSRWEKSVSDARSLWLSYVPELLEREGTKPAAIRRQEAILL